MLKMFPRTRERKRKGEVTGEVRKMENERREGKGREGKGREGREGREGKGREGKGREGKGGKGREWKGKCQNRQGVSTFCNAFYSPVNLQTA
jgi:hypothetical protein